MSGEVILSGSLLGSMRLSDGDSSGISTIKQIFGLNLTKSVVLHHSIRIAFSIKT